MKKLKKFAALLLVGALVLSVLTGCGKSDAKIVKDVLNAMTQAGEAHKVEDAEGNTRIYENKELASERDKILALFKAENGRVYDVNSGKNAQDYFIELYDEDYNLYGAAVCTLPKGTIDWKNICTQMLPAMWRFWGSADDRNLGVYIEVLHNYKMSDDQKGETYIIFLTKQGTEDDGGGIIVM